MWSELFVKKDDWIALALVANSRDEPPGVMASHRSLPALPALKKGAVFGKTHSAPNFCCNLWPNEMLELQVSGWFPAVFSSSSSSEASGSSTAAWTRLRIRRLARMHVARLGAEWGCLLHLFHILASLSCCLLLFQSPGYGDPRCSVWQFNLVDGQNSSGTQRFQRLKLVASHNGSSTSC